jgi:regulatory protein
VAPRQPPRDGAAAEAARRERRARVTDPDLVMGAAAAFLAARPRSVSETRARLLRLGYPAPTCDEVIERLVRLGYLDDLAFARAWVESRDRARPRGSLALRRELAQKGLERTVIEAALAERSASGADAGGGGWDDAEDADVSAARRLLERRATALRREPDPRRRRQRAYALLARHGFTPDACEQAVAGFEAGEPRFLDEGV